MGEPEKEYERMLDEYIKQAENGDVITQRILGDIYFYGITVSNAYW